MKSGCGFVEVIGEVGVLMYDFILGGENGDEIRVGEIVVGFVFEFYVEEGGEFVDGVVGVV